MSEFPSLAEVLAKHTPIHDPHGHINGTVPGSVAVYDCLAGCVLNTTHSGVVAHQADAWREACTITTVEQLDALPFLSLIRDVFRTSPSGANYGGVYERRTSGWQCLAGVYVEPDANAEPRLPALLIWSPDWAR